MYGKAGQSFPSLTDHLYKQGVYFSMPKIDLTMGAKQQRKKLGSDSAQILNLVQVQRTRSEEKKYSIL